MNRKENKIPLCIYIALYVYSYSLYFKLHLIIGIIWCLEILATNFSAESIL